MSIQLAINFNENDVSTVYDYSTNALNSTSVANLTTSTDPDAFPYSGYWGVFNGTSTDINFGDILDFNNDTLSLFTRFGFDDSQESVLCYKSGAFELRINASEQIVFKITISSVEYTLTTTGNISADVNPTICAVYDGVNMSIYIKGNLKGQQAQTGAIDSSSSDFIIGSDSDASSFASGDMEVFSVYSQALSADNVMALHERPGGLLLNLADSSNYSLGDLLEITMDTSVNKGVLVNDIGSGQILYLPISGGIPNSLAVVRHRGNVYNTALQYMHQQQIINDSPEYLVQDGVENFNPTEFVNNRVQISKATIAQDNIDLLKLALLGN